MNFEKMSSSLSGLSENKELKKVAGEEKKEENKQGEGIEEIADSLSGLQENEQLKNYVEGSDTKNPVAKAEDEPAQENNEDLGPDMKAEKDLAAKVAQGLENAKFNEDLQKDREKIAALAKGLENAKNQENNQENLQNMPLPSEAPQIFRKKYETEKNTSGSIPKWLWERIKGIGTLGFWSVHQAEKFRTRTGAESKKLSQESQNVQQVENLDYDVAYAEAERMKQMAEASGKKESADYEKFSQMITAGKIESNNREIERIMKESTLRLEQEMKRGWLEGYKTNTGGSVINNENMEAYQVRLRDQLMSLQKGALNAKGELPMNKGNEEALLKAVRAIHPEWKHRYFYAPVEMVGGAILLKLAAGAIVSKLAGGKAVEAGAAKAAAAKAGAGKVLEGKAVESLYAMKKGDTLWGITKATMMKMGIAHPTNLQLVEYTKLLAEANHVGVNVWSMAGTPLDTMMPVGTKVSLTALKAALGAI